MSESFDSYRDRQLVLDHEANPEEFRQPLPFRHRYFKNAETSNEWIWDGRKMTTDGEDSIFRSPAEILECLDVIEVDENGDALEPSAEAIAAERGDREQQAEADLS